LIHFYKRHIDGCFKPRQDNVRSLGSKPVFHLLYGPGVLGVEGKGSYEEGGLLGGKDLDVNSASYLS